MKIYKIISLFMFVLAVLALGVSYTFSGYEVCEKYPFACTTAFLQIRTLLFVLSVPFVILSPVLYFTQREVFTAWSKFAIIGFPVMLGGLLYAFNIEQSTGSWIGGPTEAQIASFLLPGLFLLISLIMIITKSIKLRRVG